MKKIVLITTGQPSTNPRLVKEADSLATAGYEVTVLYCFCIQWAIEMDRALLAKAAWKHQMVGGRPGCNKPTYLGTKFRFKFARFLNRFLPANVFAERAEARAYDELLKTAIKQKADLYIGHNLGALSVAVRAARFHNAKAGFDFEDYHRGEWSAGNWNAKRIAFLENKYLQELSYYSTSSPCIAKAVQADHWGFGGKRILLLNCFPLQQQPAFRRKDPCDQTLSLFWFSQTIGPNRGLETLIESLKKLAHPAISLTLVGRCTREMQTQLEELAGPLAASIYFQGLIPPADLPEFASQFDVGLATETGFSVNNNFALSNKLLTYLLAGNAILVSDTEMQKTYMEAHAVGQLFTMNDAADLARAIKSCFNNEYLNKQKRQNYELAKNWFNWETEAVKLIETIDSIVGVKRAVQRETVENGDCAIFQTTDVQIDENSGRFKGRKEDGMAISNCRNSKTLGDKKGTF